MKTLLWSPRRPRRLVGMVGLLFVLCVASALPGMASYLAESRVGFLIAVAAAKNACVGGSEVARAWEVYFGEWCDWFVHGMPWQR